MSITILNPGMLTSVQDLGRIGYQQYGVSVSGVMDPRSASIANILVDNDEGPSFFKRVFNTLQYLRGLSLSVNTATTSTMEKYHSSLSLSHTVRTFFSSKTFIAFCFTMTLFF